MGCPGHVINNGSPGVNPFRHGGTRGTGNNGRKSGPNLHERAGEAHTLPGQGPVQWHPGPGSNIPGGGSLSPNHWGAHGGADGGGAAGFPHPPPGSPTDPGFQPHPVTGTGEFAGFVTPGVVSDPDSGPGEGIGSFLGFRCPTRNRDLGPGDGHASRGSQGEAAGQDQPADPWFEYNNDPWAQGFGGTSAQPRGMDAPPAPQDTFGRPARLGSGGSSCRAAGVVHLRLRGAFMPTPRGKESFSMTSWVLTLVRTRLVARLR
jgi:hypothetical protein